MLVKSHFQKALLYTYGEVCLKQEKGGKIVCIMLDLEDFIQKVLKKNSLVIFLG